MVRLVVSTFFFALGVPAVVGQVGPPPDARQAAAVRYFRSERTFLSGVEISQDDLGWRSYLKARYDSTGKLIRKDYFKRQNRLDRFETFRYDTTTGQLTLKSLFSADSSLQRYTRFGAREEMSGKFIRYTYGISSVRDYDDRFTSVEHTADAQPQVYRFYDVDGFMYGAIEMTYDEDGHVRQEDWMVMPSEKVVRRYVKRFDEHSGETDIWEYDSTLTVVNEMTIDAEGFAPIVSLSFPTDGLAVNEPRLSYHLKEDLAEGSVTWDWAGGVPDTLAPHVGRLISPERSRGDHQNVLLRHSPQLQDSAQYTVTFFGAGESGYPARTIVLTQVAFDTTPPVYAIDAPQYSNRPLISYTLDEGLSTAEVVWVWEQGARDDTSPHVIGLSPGMLEAGIRDSLQLGEDVQLKDGTTYAVLFQGKDIAGNRGPFLSVSGVVYDTTRPELVWKSPDSGGFVNSSVVSFASNENLLEAEIRWENVGGVPDDEAPHVVELVGSELGGGKHYYEALTNSPVLVDGAVYSVTMTGKDLAGNEAPTVAVSHIAYDSAPPSLAAISPASDLAVRSGEVIYSLTEDFVAAEIDWQLVGAAASDPRNINLKLTGEGLSQGDHRLDDSTFAERLTDGGIFTVRITGRDRAGNEALPVTISNVKFDITAPEFVDVTPADSAFVMSPHVSYSLSEDLAEGTVIWTQIAGELDFSSPQMMPIPSERLTVGVHDSVLADASPSLQDGSIYAVSFMGVDAAGNRSLGASAKDVMFDITPPEITFTFPDTGSHIPTTAVSYYASEQLKRGEVVWEWIDGMLDVKAPHTAALAGDELSKGDHERLLLENAPELVSGGVYHVTIEARDLSGKTSEPKAASRVTFDNTPPNVLITAPLAEAYRNQPSLGYELSEPLSSASIVWTRTDGEADETSPHRVALDSVELSGGVHADSLLVNTPSLTDGAVYEVSFVGIDSAGNVSDTASVVGIIYDITPPVVTVSYPADSIPTRNTDVAYELSEPLLSGEVIWAWAGGESDRVGRYVQALSGDGLSMGEHGRNTIVDSPPGLVEGAVYTVTMKGVDLAGNTSEPTIVAGVLFDATSPLFAEVSPDSGSYINSSRMTYHISESIAEGTVIWESRSPEIDSVSQHVIRLEGEELARGLHEAITLANAPELVDGAVYDLKIAGSDAAQNASDTVVVAQITYDDQPPVVALSEPSGDAFISSSILSYAFSELLSSATAAWERTGGSRDPASQHEVTLLRDELSEGDHPETKLFNEPALAEGATYRLTLAGVDLAGNESEPVVIENLTFDATPPVLADVTPASDSDINAPLVGFWSSENLTEGRVVWRQIAGAEDANSPHVSTLSGAELNSGTHAPARLTETPTLVDGAVYELKLAGSDPAGNVSDTVRVDSVRYDITRPVMTVESPGTETFVNSPDVAFSLSEAVGLGTIAFQRTGGLADPNSPHVVNIPPAQRSAGQYTSLDSTVWPALNDGTIYRITTTATDRAGNDAEVVIIEGVGYDITPPVITELAPSGSTAVNHTRFSYTLSEQMVEGTVRWTRTGGAEDDGSPHLFDLQREQMSEGASGEITLASGPPLVDGAEYSFSVLGRDASGNWSDSVVVADLQYDVTPPAFSVAHPRGGMFVPDSRVAYDLTEPLTEGRVTWRQTGGATDSRSPHVLRLVGEELSAEPYDSLLFSVPPLADGGVYSVIFAGSDAAGNEAEEVIMADVKIDYTPPVLALTAPTAGAAIMSSAVAYSLSENVKQANMFWTHVEGPADPSSPHTVPLDAEELEEGDHPEGELIFPPLLVDGSLYNISFAAVDFAGNVSDTVIVEGLRYDVTPPVIAVDSPASGAFLNAILPSYSFSEQMSDAAIVWTRIDGAGDAASPHTSALTENELTAGDHGETALLNLPALVDGAVYSASFSGKDMAGNDAEHVLIDRITYDVTAPVIAISAPESDVFIDEPVISMSLSENLNRGEIIWQDVTNPASSQTMVMTADLMAEGEHVKVSLSDSVRLSDGTTYRLMVSGRDRAGNEATPATVESIGFDTSPPTLAINLPSEGAFINSSAVTYSLSENLMGGTLTWARSGGAADDSPARVITLSEQALSGGDHPDFASQQITPLVSGAVYSVTLSGLDLAGNEGTPATITDLSFDDTPPIIAASYPAVDQFVNSREVAFSFSETLERALVTWTRVGSREDLFSPHEVALSEAERAAGEHPPASLSQPPELMDGAQYDIAFTGVDLAGNAAEGVLISGVTYDVSPPVVSIESPTTMSAINSSEMTYTLSEELREGKVVWAQLAGETDAGSPHETDLTSEERAGGSHEKVTLSAPPALADGGIYTVSILGVDRAGNQSETVSSEQILFDVTPPTIVASSPTPTSLVNTTSLSYSLSETLSSGTVTWTRIGGVADPSSPHELPLSSLELAEGEHSELILSTPPNLVSGSVYSIAFSGEDPAGNPASGMTIEAVTFDNTPPALALEIPGGGVAVREVSITYSLSETLASGTVTFERTSGAEDSSSPHAAELTDAEKTAGDHTAVTLTNGPTLVTGAIYRITLAGSDAAANVGAPAVLSGILYDAVPPVITLTSPASGGYLNKLDVAYSLSEPLTKGAATWTQTGGSPDPQSPRVVELTVPEMGSGDRSAVLSNQVLLMDGAIYSLSFSGSDAAGNEAEVVTVTDLTYDVTPPLFSGVAPSEGYTNAKTLSYTLTESLAEGSIVFAHAGGTPNGNSPYAVPLSGVELAGGVHDNIVLSGAPTLVSGASYTMTFSGLDSAGNSADRLQVGPVLYDDTAPVVLVTGPVDGGAVNHSLIDYQLSEPLASGSVTWTPTQGESQVKVLSNQELDAGLHQQLKLRDSPRLSDGTVYTLTFEGTDHAGNELTPVVVSDVTFDTTPPKIKVQLAGPGRGLFVYESPVGITLSEDMGEVAFRWEREGGSEDPTSPHTLYVAGDDLGEGEHSEVHIPGSEAVLIGTSYTLFVAGKDRAGNSSTEQKVENIEIVRYLDGDWAYQGIATIVWAFSGGEEFSQGVLFGNTLSDEKPGKYAIDWSKRPFRLAIRYDDGTRRYGLFEFIGHNKLRVVSSADKRPSSWSDGDYFEFEYREKDIP